MIQPADTAVERFGLKRTLIEQINRVIGAYPEIERVVLYGSRAKGNYKPSSDIDLALIGDQLTELRLLELETRLDDLLLPYKLDLCRFHTLQNPSLIEHINRVGQEFFTRTRMDQPARNASSP
jgi:predicted nucleotidyltransferase